MAHYKIAEQMNIVEGDVNSLVVEDKKSYRNILSNLSQIVSKEYEGGFTFLRNSKKLDHKTIEFIPDVFTTSLSDKRILKSLEKRMNDFVQEDYALWTELRSNIEKFMEGIEDRVEYELERSELVPENLIKIFDYHIFESGSDVEIKLLDYMTLLSDMVGIKLFIMTDFSEYFTDCEIQDLLKSFKLKEFTILVLSTKENRNIQNKIIIDKDWCLI